MQISSNYSMNGVPYENRRRQNDIPQFSTERAEQENESINPSFLVSSAGVISYPQPAPVFNNTFTP